MAKIDSVGRMRLPPDSGIRTQAHSRREHATSEPVKQAMTEWFQAIQGTRREAADEPLTQAIRHALADRVSRGESTPRALPILVLNELPAKGSDRHQYQVQLGQSLLVLSSKVPLQPGQTLVATPGDKGPVILNPLQPEQQHQIRILTQQQQLHWLPAPQARTSLAALIPWASGFASTLPPSVMATPSTGSPAQVANTSAAESAATGVPRQDTGNTPTVNWLAQALRHVLAQWQQTLVSVNTTGRDTGASNVAATSTPSPAGLNGAGIQLSDHWIPQLIRSATQEYGEATAKTVRQVFQSWQQTALNQARNVPLPDLSQVNLRPVTQPSGALIPPAPLLAPSSLTSGNLTNAMQPPAPPVGGPDRSGTPPANTQTSVQQAAASAASPPTLADLVPLLKRPTQLQTLSGRDGDSGVRPNPHVPADIWRLAAEQLIDLRLQQLGNTPQHSLQEALQRRAEQLLRQVTTTYSPTQLKQQLQRGTAPGGNAPAGGGSQATEQQALLQVRQLLEQVSQQQQTRTLTALQPDTPNEPPRQLQGIPLLADQQLIWFDLERQQADQGSDEKTSKPQEWVLDLHFQLPPMAPVCARLHWQQDHARLEMLTDDMPTLRLLHSHLQGLQERLHNQQLPVEEVQVRHGLPKRAGKQGSAGTPNETTSQRIDIKT